MLSDKNQGSKLDGSKMGSNQQEEVLLQGQGQFKNKIKLWSPCYFVLHPHYFLVFKYRNHDEGRPTRTIHLKDILQVIAEQRNQFSIKTSNDKHELKMSSNQQLVKWMGAINKMIVRYRNLRNME